MNFQQIFTQQITALCQENLSQFPYIQDYLLTPGKQFRPKMFLDLISQSRPLNDSDHHIAAGLEMLHLFFLVHDDLMDGDQLRRNQITIHAYFEKQFGPTKSAGLAIIVGDLLFSRAVNLITSNLSHPLAKSTLFEVIDLTAKGQLEEYFFTPDNSPEPEKILHFYEHKTALYSIYLPLALAYFQSTENPSTSHLIQLKTYSQHLGRAFQLYDDLIEFNLEKMRSQNSNCSDVMRGKITPILSYIMKKSPAEKIQKWQGEWKNQQLSLHSHNEILELGKTLGAISYARELIRENLEQSRQLGENLQLNQISTLQYLDNLINQSL